MALIKAAARPLRADARPCWSCNWNGLALVTRLFPRSRLVLCSRLVFPFTTLLLAIPSSPSSFRGLSRSHEIVRLRDSAALPNYHSGNDRSVCEGASMVLVCMHTCSEPWYLARERWYDVCTHVREDQLVLIHTSSHGRALASICTHVG